MCVLVHLEAGCIIQQESGGYLPILTIPQALGAATTKADNSEKPKELRGTWDDKVSRWVLGSQAR